MAFDMVDYLVDGKFLLLEEDVDVQKISNCCILRLQVLRYRYQASDSSHLFI